MYEYLRQAHAGGEFSLAGATAWSLDEYVNIPGDHPERYRCKCGGSLFVTTPPPQETNTPYTP